MASKVRCRLGDRAKIASEHWANRIHGKRVLEKAKRKFSSNASAWAKKVMARDEMICQDCGTIEGELHAHHIVPVSVAPHLVSDVDNGVTLCAPCHRKRHGAKAGKKAIKPVRKAA